MNWAWHDITHKDWYAIKYNQTNKKSGCPHLTYNGSNSTKTKSNTLFSFLADFNYTIDWIILIL